MNLTKNTSVFKFNNITIIGEVHGGIKEKTLSKYINKMDKTIIILECHKNIMDLKINDIKKHYNKKIKTNKQNQDDSYIDNVIYFFINKYANLLNKNKIFKDVMKNKKIKLVCLDDRKIDDYPKKQVRTIFKNNKNKYDNLKNKIIKIKKDIEKFEESKIKQNLLKNIDLNLLKLNEKSSSYIFQTISEIILNYNIIKFILKKTNKKDNIIIIVGKNHLNDLKKFF
jgi:hypothetical protein